MLDFSMEIKICTLQEYLELTGMSEEQVWKDWGIVTKHYVCGICPDYNRAFACVVDGNYVDAIKKVTERLLMYYK